MFELEEKAALRGKPSAASASSKRAPSKKRRKQLTGYMLFAIAMRESVRDENAGVSFGDLNKKLGQMQARASTLLPLSLLFLWICLALPLSLSPNG